MPDPSATPRRAAAVVGLTALALSLTGAPAFALDSPLPDPVVQLLSPSPSPSPSPSDGPSSDPLPVPVPEPLQPVVDVVESLLPAPPPSPDAQPVPAPAPAPATGTGAHAPAPAAAPAPDAAPQVVAQDRAGGTGAASLSSLGGLPGLSAGTGTAAQPMLGAPMIAAAPAFTLPGLPEPMTAPAAEVAAARPASTPATPAGLPALVVAVAAVALVAAGAGHVAELRVRRAAAPE